MKSLERENRELRQANETEQHADVSGIVIMAARASIPLA